MYSHFPSFSLQCMTFGAKMLRVLLFLGWTFMNVARHDKAWYHYKDVCACWESMRLSSLHRLAISSNSIKTYLLQSIWQGQHVLVIKNDSGRAPFSRGNCISHHRPSTNVDSMAFPQTCQIARVRGRSKRVPIGKPIGAYVSAILYAGRPTCPASEDGSRRFRPWNRGGFLAMLRWIAFP